MTVKEQSKPINQRIYDYLVSNINEPITHEELIGVVYDRVYNVKTQRRALDVHLLKTKQKLQEEGYLLQRNYGIGYTLLKIVN